MSEKYIATINDQIRKYCISCNENKPIYIIYENGQLIIACCHCQRIHKEMHV